MGLESEVQIISSTWFLNSLVRQQQAFCFGSLQSVRNVLLEHAELIHRLGIGTIDQELEQIKAKWG